MWVWKNRCIELDKTAISLSRNPVIPKVATGFLTYLVQKQQKNKRWKWSFHFHNAKIFEFMATNLSFTQFVT